VSLVGGEAVNVKAMKKVLINGPPGNLWNVYGPTEATIFGPLMRTFFIALTFTASPPTRTWRRPRNAMGASKTMTFQIPKVIVTDPFALSDYLKNNKITVVIIPTAPFNVARWAVDEDFLHRLDIHSLTSHKDVAQTTKCDGLCTVRRRQPYL
jgi:hypothetical protein